MTAIKISLNKKTGRYILWCEVIMATKGMLKDGLDLNEVAHFIVIALNGAAPFYAATRDSRVWEQTVRQLHYYINQLRE